MRGRRRLPLAVGALAVLIVAGIAGYVSGNQPPLDVVHAAETRLSLRLRTERVPTNGIDLHVVTAGPANGPPVVLLHGFPEFWWGWNQQALRLAHAGFRVIMPDQRGYDLSDKPQGIDAYRIETLGRDIVGLIQAFGYERVFLAGHDWGGVVAWHLALEHPDRVRRLVAFNMGHPLAFADAAASAPEQKTVSWYRTFFQMPLVPELATRFGNWRLLAQNLRDTSRPGTFTDQELTFYKSAWARDGAIRGMINWYRAAYRYPHSVSGDGLVSVPVRIVWGMKDAFLESRLARLSVPHCTNASIVELPDATHWLLHEEPERTSQEMIEFFHEGY